MSALKPEYQCPECGDLHDEEGGAVECCPRDAVQVVWRCPICKARHYSEARAIDCHGWEPPDPDAPCMPTPAELEAAGQMRLLP